MISSYDVMKGVAKYLSQLDEIKEIYIEYQEKTFDRPSLLIECTRTNEIDKNYSTVRVEQYMLITIFTEVNDYDHISTKRQLELEDKILKLLRKGYIEVDTENTDEKNRYIKIKASNGGKEYDRSYIDLQCSYLDDRGLEEKEYSTAESVVLEFKKEREED